MGFILRLRFYGGFWITIPNKKRWKDTNHKLHTDGIEFRRRILVDGEPTVEIDFSSMHTRIIYHLKGIAYDEDPYLAVVKKYPEIDGKPVLRSHVKLTINIMLNFKKEDAVATIANEWNRNDENTTSMDHSFSSGLIDAICDVHMPIIDYMSSYQANKLMHLDSVIIEKVMLTMIEKYDSIALPVHDSVIVKKSDKHNLICAMEGAYEEVFQSMCEMKIVLGEKGQATIHEKITASSTGIDDEESTFEWRDRIDQLLNKEKDD